MIRNRHLLLPPPAPRRRPVVIHEIIILPAARKQILLASVAARRLRRVPHRRRHPCLLLVVRPVEVQPVEHARRRRARHLKRLVHLDLAGARDDGGARRRAADGAGRGGDAAAVAAVRGGAVGRVLVAGPIRVVVGALVHFREEELGEELDDEGLDGGDGRADDGCVDLDA